MQQDTFTARVAALALAAALLGLIGVIALLAHEGKEVPAVLAGSLGLVLGALVPSPISRALPAPPDIHVSQVAADPEATARAVAAKLQAPRTRGQKGEVGCALLAILALSAIGAVALVVWAFS